MSPEPAYETVIGLEIHVQLDTRSKLFCGCEPTFGDVPNSHTCPVCLGLPGALPVLNRAALAKARLVALALGCRLNDRSRFARKNYFYPDLPKGYQISQYEQPIGEDGRFEFWHDDGVCSAGIVRVHLEEDAGKSTHRSDERGHRSLIDFNRCGTPLVETVTRPDLRSPEEASDFLESLRTTLLQLGVTDASMEEGSLRCDANISLRRVGAADLNPKTELKNLNSFRYLRHALRYEERRQRAILESGEVPLQSTRQWDEASGRSLDLRSKEEAHDYRYFPDPDLVDVCLEDDERRALAAALPELPVARSARYARSWGVAQGEAHMLAEDADRARLFERLVDGGVSPGDASNWLRGPVQAWLNEMGLPVRELPLDPGALAELIGCVADGTVSLNAARELLPRVIAEGCDPRSIIEAEGLRRLADPTALSAVIEAVLQEHAVEAEAYRSGNAKVLGYLMGQVMKRTSGRADPVRARALLAERLAR